MCRYPHSLHFLDLLQKKDFRVALGIKGVKVMHAADHSSMPGSQLGSLRTGRCDMQELIESQQFHFWQHKTPGPPKPQE